MTRPKGSLGFLKDKAQRPRVSGRTLARLWLGRPDRGQFALSHPKGDDLDPESDAQLLSYTECSPPTHASSAGHVPQRRAHGADVSDEISVDRRTGAL